MAVIRGLAVLSGLLLADSQPVTSNNPTVPLCVTCRHEKISVCNARCRKGIFIVYGSLTPIYSNYSFRIFNRKCLCRFGIAISPLWLATNGYPVSAIRICEICSRYGFGILINICRKNIPAWCYLNVAKQNIWCAWESHRKQYRHRISGKSPLLLCSYCNVSPI